MSDAVTFSQVEKRFGSMTALAGVDLSIRTGETVALLGPNGAGKSTAVGLMLGLREPTAGTVRILGGPATAAVRQGRVAAMLQTASLLPGVSVAELVGFIRALYPHPLPAAHALEVAGCTAFAHQPVERLSGGQAQRARFAMAIAGDPELLFLDEPTTGFDVDARRHFWQGIRAFAASGRTVLFATHYLEEADAVADRIIVLQRGRVLADGSAAAIKASAGGRVVRFQAAGIDRSSCERLAGVSQVEIDGDRVRLRTADPDATVAAAYAAGIPVRGLEIGGADLEEAFLALVNAETDAKGASGR